MKKGDKIFLPVVFIISLVLFFGFKFFFNPKGSFCEITVDGEIIGRFSLEEEREIPLDTVKETSVMDNIVKIEGGMAYMFFANCPDKTCIRMGKISQVNSQVVCLPHKVIVRIVSDGSSEIDTVAQ